MKSRMIVAAVGVAVLCAACKRPASDPNPERNPTKTRQRPGATRLALLGGLHQPESVRYDPDLDVYYVSNMTGYGSVKDDNGYIVRVPADNFAKGSILAEGGQNGVVLDSPKGLALHGDTLWTADIDVLRGFNRRTGIPVANIDLKPQGAVLLNDVAVGGDGRLYVTDSGILMTEKGVIHVGGDKVFSIGPDGVSIIAQGNRLGRPNGITWDAKNGRLLVASFDPFHSEVYAITPGSNSLRVISTGLGKFDGLEILADGRMLVSCWTDSAVLAVDGDKVTQVADRIPQPADIGIDTRRNRLAVPSSALGRVELWDLSAAH